MRRGRKEAELHIDSQEPSKLGDALRNWRHIRGLTVSDLAVQAGFGRSGRSYISKVEHGAIRLLGEQKLQAILQALAIRAEDLYQGQVDAWAATNRPDAPPSGEGGHIQPMMSDLPTLFAASTAFSYIDELATNFTAQGSIDPIVEHFLLQIESRCRAQLHQFLQGEVKSLLVTFFEDALKARTAAQSTP